MVALMAGKYKKKFFYFPRNERNTDATYAYQVV